VTKDIYFKIEASEEQLAESKREKVLDAASL